MERSNISMQATEIDTTTFPSMQYYVRYTCYDLLYHYVSLSYSFNTGGKMDLHGEKKVKYIITGRSSCLM